MTRIPVKVSRIFSTILSTFFCFVLKRRIPWRETKVTTSTIMGSITKKERESTGSTESVMMIPPKNRIGARRPARKTVLSIPWTE